MKNIVLIGMMGCGKSSIGKQLARKLKLDWIDLDDYIEMKYATTISKLFEAGEANFRHYEHICCVEVSKRKKCLISTGGGIVMNDENIKALKKNSIIIYLDRPINEIVKDINISKRPLLKDGTEKLYELYELRHQKYIDACDIHIINDGPFYKTIQKIINVLKNNAYHS